MVGGCQRTAPDNDLVIPMETRIDSQHDLVALSIVMEGRVALDDGVRVLMVRQQLDRERATDAIVRAAAFASDEYGGHPLDRRVAQAL
jgi:hypothetical protein